MKPNRKTSNPRGVGESKRISLSLLPNEMAKVEHLAIKYGASKSLIIRSLVLMGLQQKTTAFLRNTLEENGI